MIVGLPREALVRLLEVANDDSLIDVELPSSLGSLKKARVEATLNVPAAELARWLAVTHGLEDGPRLEHNRSTSLQTQSSSRRLRRKTLMTSSDAGRSSSGGSSASEDEDDEDDGDSLRSFIDDDESSEEDGRFSARSREKRSVKARVVEKGKGKARAREPRSSQKRSSSSSSDEDAKTDNKRPNRRTASPAKPKKAVHQPKKSARKSAAITAGTATDDIADAPADTSPHLVQGTWTDVRSYATEEHDVVYGLIPFSPEPEDQDDGLEDVEDQLAEDERPRTPASAPMDEHTERLFLSGSAAASISPVKTELLEPVIPPPPRRPAPSSATIKKEREELANLFSPTSPPDNIRSRSRSSSKSSASSSESSDSSSPGGLASLALPRRPSHPQREATDSVPPPPPSSLQPRSPGKAPANTSGGVEALLDRLERRNAPQLGSAHGGPSSSAPPLRSDQVTDGGRFVSSVPPTARTQFRSITTAAPLRLSGALSSAAPVELVNAVAGPSRPSKRTRSPTPVASDAPATKGSRRASPERASSSDSESAGGGGERSGAPSNCERKRLKREEKRERKRVKPEDERERKRLRTKVKVEAEALVVAFQNGSRAASFSAQPIWRSNAAYAVEVEAKLLDLRLENFKSRADAVGLALGHWLASKPAHADRMALLRETLLQLIARNPPGFVQVLWAFIKHSEASPELLSEPARRAFQRWILQEIREADRASYAPRLPGFAAVLNVDPPGSITAHLKQHVLRVSGAAEGPAAEDILLLGGLLERRLEWLKGRGALVNVFATLKILHASRLEAHAREALEKVLALDTNDGVVGSGDRDAEQPVSDKSPLEQVQDKLTDLHPPGSAATSSGAGLEKYLDPIVRALLGWLRAAASAPLSRAVIQVALDRAHPFFQKPGAAALLWARMGRPLSQQVCSEIASCTPAAYAARVVSWVELLAPPPGNTTRAKMLGTLVAAHVERVAADPSPGYAALAALSDVLRPHGAALDRLGLLDGAFARLVRLREDGRITDVGARMVLHDLILLRRSGWTVAPH